MLLFERKFRTVTIMAVILNDITGLASVFAILSCNAKNAMNSMSRTWDSENVPDRIRGWSYIHCAAASW